MTSRVLSVSAGRPRDIVSRGRTVTTSIFKSPVSGRVAVRWLNIEGDEQSDLTVHGGADKAVYVYPSEHYDFWHAELPGVPLPPGAFGENLTTEGLLEDAVLIGDRLRIGSAEFLVTQPRLPCFKLGIRFDRLDMVKRFLASRRTGFYLRVLREGDLAAGDDAVVVARGEGGVSVADIVRLYAGDDSHPGLRRRAVGLQALPENWRGYFRE